MENVLEFLEIIESFDDRQQSKVKYKLSEIIGISLFAMIGNANTPEEIEVFCRSMKPFYVNILTFKWNTISRYNTTSF